MKHLLSGLYVVLVATRLLAATHVSGLVFCDRNGNGRLDAGEKGLAGVAVTDGVNIVVTDGEGKYSMDAEIDRDLLQPDKKPILTVTFPTGYWPTTPFFRRLADEKDLSSVHFGLREDEQSLPFVFIHATDCHVPRGGKELFLKFRSDVADLAERARFCILTGDLVNMGNSDPFDKVTADFALFVEDTRDFPLPLFCIPGNHDTAGVDAVKGWDKNDPMYAYGMYWRHVGPLRWSFDYAGIHMAGIDFNHVDQGKWKWGIPASALSWLRKDLARLEKGKRIFLLVHYPQGPKELEGILKELGVSQIFAGHTHSEEATRFGAIPLLLSGSLSQTGGDRQPGFRIVEVAEDGLHTFYKASGNEHAVTIDSPRRSATVKPDSHIVGGFYDPAARIRTLTVALGDVGGEVPFGRTPVCCRFDAAFDFSNLASGFQKLRVTLSDGAQTWTQEDKYLVLTSKQDEFPAEGPATLSVEVGGIDTGADLDLNGELLQRLDPTPLKGERFAAPVKDTSVVRIDVPPDRLRRLNTVALRCSPGPDGNPDVFCVLDVKMEYQGRTCRDSRVPYGRYHPRIVKGTTSYYIDLALD